MVLIEIVAQFRHYAVSYTQTNIPLIDKLKSVPISIYAIVAYMLHNNSRSFLFIAVFFSALFCSFSSFLYSARQYANTKYSTFSEFTLNGWPLLFVFYFCCVFILSLSRQLLTLFQQRCLTAIDFISHLRILTSFMCYTLCTYMSPLPFIYSSLARMLTNFRVMC